MSITDNVVFVVHYQTGKMLGIVPKTFYNT